MNEKYYCIESYCNNEICYSNWKYGQRRCRSCSKKDKKHSRWKGDKAVKRQTYYCKEEECDNEISYETWKKGKGRCMKCAGKIHSKRMKDNKHGLIDGKCSGTYYCKKCGGKISLGSAIYGSGLCWKCYWKFETHSKNHRLRISKARKGKYKGKNAPMFGKKAPNGKRIYYKGICMRSSWETLFAQFLSLNGIKWKYEPKAFDLGEMTYRPDFYLPEFDCYIEIKGWWRKKAKTKFRFFKKYYPKINIKVLMEKELKELGIL